MRRVLGCSVLGAILLVIGLAVFSVLLVCGCSPPPLPTRTPSVELTAEASAEATADIEATYGAIRANNIPGVILSAEPDTVRVGDLVWVRIEAINLGMPQYTFTLTPGGQFIARYGMNAAPEMLQTPAAQMIFEFAYPDQVLFGSRGDGIPLRAIRPGSAELLVHISGEAYQQQFVNGTPMQAFYFTGGTASIRLTAIEARSP